MRWRRPCLTAPTCRRKCRVEPVSDGYILDNLLLFGRVCKVLGMDITPGRMIEASEAVRAVGIHNRQDFYYALRGLMVTRRRDLAVFDEAFLLFWKEPSGDFIPLDRTLPGNQNREYEYTPPPEDPTESNPEKNALRGKSLLRRADLQPARRAALQELRGYDRG